MAPFIPPHRYQHHRFPAKLIRHGVWLYERFCLRSGDVAELLFVRRILVTYEAIRKWGRQCGQPYAPQLRRPGQGTRGSGKRCCAPWRPRRHRV